MQFIVAFQTNHQNSEKEAFYGHHDIRQCNLHYSEDPSCHPHDYQHHKHGIVIFILSSSSQRNNSSKVATGGRFPSSHPIPSGHLLNKTHVFQILGFNPTCATTANWRHSMVQSACDSSIKRSKSSHSSAASESCIVMLWSRVHKDGKNFAMDVTSLKLHNYTSIYISHDPHENIVVLMTGQELPKG